MTTRSPLLFISYRRKDSVWIARSLHRYLSERLGTNAVFMDRTEIRSGDNWRAAIDTALGQSTVVLALIGREWLGVEDSRGRKRIDDPEDWVHREIKTGLSSNKRLIPAYVDGAERIAPKYFPKELRGLDDKQAIFLGEENFDIGLLQLLDRLREYGFKVFQSEIPMPERRKRVEPLSREQLESLPEDLRGRWVVSASYEQAAGGAIVPREALYREFRFSTFPDATRFMCEVSPEIEEGQHHPRWENVWTTVRVWLNTWDIEFKPSEFDLDLARLLERRYREFREKRRDQK